MSRIVLVLLVVMAVFSASSHSQQCGQNEEYNACGSACEPACGQAPKQVCTAQCIIGCQCKSGYLRNNNGACVSPQEC